MNVYYKIMKEYMKKRISVYVLMVITIIATFVLVFTPIIVVKSQCINTIAYLNKYKSKYDGIAKDISKNELDSISKNKDVKALYTQKNIGKFRENNKVTKYDIRTYNSEILDLEKIKIVEGRSPNNKNEIIVSNKSLLKNKYGKNISGIITKDYINNGKHELINSDSDFKIVGVYERDKRTQEILEKLQVSDTNQIFTSESYLPSGKTRYDAYLNFNRGRGASSIIYEMNTNIFGGDSRVESNQLSDKISDSFINATDDAIRLFKPIIISSCLVIFLIYLLVFEDRKKIISTVQIIGGEKKRIVKSMFIENISIIVFSTIIGILLGSILSKILIQGEDLTGFVAEFDIIDKKMYISFKDIVNSSLVSAISLISITIYETATIIRGDMLRGTSSSYNNLLLKRIKAGAKCDNLLKMSFSYYISSLKRYIIPMIIMIMFGNIFISYFNIEKNDAQFSDRTRFDQINMYRNYGLQNNSYLGNKNTLIHDQKFKNKITNTKYEYSTEAFINVNTKNLDKYYLEMLGDSVKRDSMYELNILLRGISKAEREDLFKKSVLTDDDIKILNTSGFILINGFRNRDMGLDMKIFSSMPTSLELKYKVYDKDRERYSKLESKDVITHEYDEKYKSISAEFDHPMVIVSEDFLKKITGIKEALSIYFDAKDTKGENYINNLFARNEDFTIFNAKYFKDKNAITSRILYRNVKYINMSVLLLLMTISMFFAVKLTIIFREKEINSIRAIGGSKKQVLKIFLYEGLFIAFICSSVSLVTGIKKGYINYLRYLGEQSDKTDIHFLMDYMSIFSCLIFIFVISLVFQIVILKRNRE